MTVRTRTVPVPPCMGGARPPRRDQGSLALEAALVLPLVALCAVALLHLVTVTRDALTVQEAARVGARVAATTADDGAVRYAVRDVLGLGHWRSAEISIEPATRRSGDTIRVEVAVPTRLGPLRPVVRGSAVSRGEPVLGGGTVQGGEP